jgi:hypothetical protein
MKTYLYTVSKCKILKPASLLYALFSLLIPAGCADPVLPSGYVPEFPRIPESWAEILGTPSWKLEWYNQNGNPEFAFVEGGTDITIPVFPEWPSPVTAWPFWPDKGIESGMFRPAGALYPFDVSGDVLRLSWRGGADVRFYRVVEEVRSRKENAHPLRKAWLFDWPRFRALFVSGLSAELREDPWIINWEAAAEKTVNSGFRTSYLKARERALTEVLIPHDGPWVSSSPFRKPENWSAGNAELLALSPETELWVCPGGMLFLSRNARLWVPR